MKKIKIVSSLRENLRKLFEIDKKIWLACGGICLVAIVLILANFYSGYPSRKFSENIFKIIPVPVAVVDKNKIIFSKELIKDSQAVKNFYQSQDFSSVGMRVDFKTQEGKMRLKIKEREVLDKLVEDQVVIKLAQERGIVISAKEAKEELARKIEEAGVEPVDFALNIRKLYNWSLQDFSDRIVYPQIYLRKLFEHYNENLAQESEAFQKIKEAEAKINQDNSNFEEVAREYSQGKSAENGGELGWFQPEQMVSEVAERAFSMEMGSRSDVIVSNLGFHIILVEKKRKTKDENGVEKEEIKLKQIITKDGGFLEWLVNKKMESDVSIWLRDYVWNKDEVQVFFKNEDLVRAEEQIRQISEGDPSM